MPRPAKDPNAPRNSINEIQKAVHRVHTVLASLTDEERAKALAMVHTLYPKA